MGQLKIYYRILKDYNLLIRTGKGIVNIYNLYQHIGELSIDSDYNPKMSVLNDFRELDFKVSEDEVKKFVQFILNNEKVYSGRVISNLTNTPNQTVFSIMLDSLKNEQQLKIRTFTTLKAAIAFLGLSSTISLNIENTLREMKTLF